MCIDFQYHPYGARHSNSSLTKASGNRWRFSGKEEFDNAFGLPQSDFGARFYDRTSWTTIDPLAEKYYSLSPYVYCAGNPIIFVDRDGRDIYRYDDKTGVFYLEIKNNDSFDQVARFRYNMKEKSYSYKFIKHKKRFERAH